MKIAGIIGGVGPDTTAEFYLELIHRCQKLDVLHRPMILICSILLPYKVEEDAILRGIGEERYVPFLIDAAQKLERAGADFLVMPCNTLHVFIENIRKSVNIPVLSIVEETTKLLKERNVLEVGILSTDITLKKNVYRNCFLENGVKQTLPDSRQQRIIGGIIYNLVMNKKTGKEEKELGKIIDTFKEKKITNILLACTDLQLLDPKISGMEIHDTMKIFAQATVQEIIKIK